MNRIVIAAVMAAVLCGCSTISMERDGSYEKITVRAPPKDFTALDFNWYETRLRAGEAATAPQPWADVTSDMIEQILPIFCATNPGACGIGAASNED